MPTDVDAQSDTARQNTLGARAARVVGSLAAVAAILLVLFTLAAFAARWHWRCEQLSHFRAQYAWLLLVTGIVLVLARRRRLATLALLACALNAIPVTAIYWPAPTKSGDGPTLKLISFNVLGENNRRSDVASFLRCEQADLVLLMEVQPPWKELTDELADIYPYQLVEARTDHFGIALLSRLPIADFRLHSFGNAAVPTIVAGVTHDQKQLLVVGTHPLPPGTAAMSRARDEQLAEVARFIKGQNRPVVLVGDLNTASYSPAFSDLCAATGLLDSRQGFGIQSSWAPRIPVLEIAIDHCLVPPEIHVASRRIGPHLGSDHRPVVVELTWAVQEP